MRAGVIFWLFVIPSVLLSLNIDTGVPEPTLIYASLVLSGFIFALLWIIGNVIIIPLSYFIIFILLILDIYRACFNKLPQQIPTNKYNLVYTALAVLGFIFGGVTSILTILYWLR